MIKYLAKMLAASLDALNSVTGLFLGLIATISWLVGLEFRQRRSKEKIKEHDVQIRDMIKHCSNHTKDENDLLRKIEGRLGRIEGALDIKKGDD